jgi:hypothetical protein
LSEIFPAFEGRVNTPLNHSFNRKERFYFNRKERKELRKVLFFNLSLCSFAKSFAPFAVKKNISLAVKRINLVRNTKINHSNN